MSLQGAAHLVVKTWMIVKIKKQLYYSTVECVEMSVWGDLWHSKSCKGERENLQDGSETCYDGGSEKISISERQFRMSSLETYVKRACMGIEWQGGRFSTFVTSKWSNQVERKKKKRKEGKEKRKKRKGKRSKREEEGGLMWYLPG